MCGICGIVYTDPKRHVSDLTLVRMRDSLMRRGPDDAGLFIQGSVGLAHRRLAILDLSSRAHQPMYSSSGRFCLTYNGEIYNYRELRDLLSQRGHRFRSDSDTEVLVQGLEEWGLLELLSRLDGMFAFAVWDRREQKLLAARDPLGVKPFFYTTNGREFLFASEIKALWAAGVPREVDPGALQELLVFRFAAAAGTPFRNIYRLEPGHYLEFGRDHFLVKPYWRAIDHVGDDPAYEEIWKKRFSQAVRDQRVSDVPLGTFLSGGLDSSTITAELARSTNEQIQTFTVSVPPEEGIDELPYADSVATRWNCKSHWLRVPSENVLDRLRTAQAYYDEPLAHGNDLYIFELSRLAKRHVTVLLSGEGADETLGGYTRYEPARYPTVLKAATSPATASLRALFGHVSNRKVRKLGRLLSAGSLEEFLLYNAADVLPQGFAEIGFPVKQRFEARRAILEQAARAGLEPIKQLMLYEIRTFLCSLLARNDHMTMAASIECRVPFLAVGVVEAALKLPVSALFSGRYGKQILRNHAADLLPQKVLGRAKWGLGIPWERYLREDPACRDFVSKLPCSELARAIEAPGLASTVTAFLAGDDRKTSLIYQLFSLGVWWEQVVSQRASMRLSDDSPHRRGKASRVTGETAEAGTRRSL